MAFSLSYCHKELLLRCCRHFGSAFNGSSWQKVILSWWKQPHNQVYNYEIVKSHILVEEDPGLLSISHMDLFQAEFNSFQGLNFAKKSSTLCVGGVPLPTSAMVFPEKYLFIRLKQKFKVFKRSQFSRSRARTPVKGEDGAISNNNLQLKAIN